MCIRDSDFFDKDSELFRRKENSELNLWGGRFSMVWLDKRFPLSLTGGRGSIKAEGGRSLDFCKLFRITTVIIYYRKRRCLENLFRLNDINQLRSCLTLCVKFFLFEVGLLRRYWFSFAEGLFMPSNRLLVICLTTYRRRGLPIHCFRSSCLLRIYGGANLTMLVLSLIHIWRCRRS